MHSGNLFVLWFSVWGFRKKIILISHIFESIDSRVSWFGLFSIEEESVKVSYTFDRDQSSSDSSQNYDEALNIDNKDNSNQLIWILIAENYSIPMS